METRLTLLLLVLLLFYACSSRSNKDIVQNIDSSSKNRKNVDTLIQKRLSGKELFETIKDTLHKKSIDYKTLLNSKWEFLIANNCINTIQFFENNTGKNIDCEIEELYEIKYKIIDDTLYIEEYTIPHVDNPEGKKLKSRDDIYVYNGHSLIMIGSTMHNIGGKSWTPKIRTVIEYKRK
jgi:hypothetical protein